MEPEVAGGCLVVQEGNSNNCSSNTGHSDEFLPSHLSLGRAPIIAPLGK